MAPSLQILDVSPLSKGLHKVVKVSAACTTPESEFALLHIHVFLHTYKI